MHSIMHGFACFQRESEIVSKSLEMADLTMTRFTKFCVIYQVLRQ